MIVKLASDSYYFISKNIIAYTQQINSTMDDVTGGPLPHYWKFYFQNISSIFLEYFHTTENTSIVWNRAKLWQLDFPTFFLTILTRYFHTMEEVQFFQCTYLTMLSTGRYTCFSSPGSVCWGIPACKDIPSCVKVRSPSCFHSLWTFLVPAVWVYRSRLQPCLLMLNITMYENRSILTIKTTTRGINTIIWRRLFTWLSKWLPFS